VQRRNSGGCRRLAQTQTPVMSLLVFALMGVGMALPYAIIVLVPSLLNKLPRPGDWMEHIRKAMGFILLLIAVKLLGALPKERLVDALFYAVILSSACGCGEAGSISPRRGVKMGRANCRRVNRCPFRLLAFAGAERRP